MASETNEAIADLSKIPASQDQRQAMCDHCGDAIHETREQYEARVREYVIQLEDEARYEAIIDEDKARYAEWTWDYQQGHGEAA